MSTNRGKGPSHILKACDDIFKGIVRHLGERHLELEEIAGAPSLRGIDLLV